MPSARRLSQTLGHAKLPTMKARLSFVAPPALLREARAAAGALSAMRLFKVTAKVSSGCPSFGGQRTVASARTLGNSELSKHLSPFKAPSVEPVSSPQLPWPGKLSQHQSSGSAQASVGQLACPASVCSAIRIQGEAASSRAWPNHSFKRTCLRQSA